MTEDQESREIRRVFTARDHRRPPAWLALGYAVLTAERRALTAKILGRELPNLAHPTILDVGCGQGLDLAWWQGRGWQPGGLAGIDLVEDRVAIARATNPGVDVRLGQGPTLPFADAAFDVATASTVFSSITSASSRRALFVEMRRVVRPAGLVVLYDFVIRNPRNADVVPMTTGRLEDLGGRPPDQSSRVSPLLYVVGPATMVHPRLGRAAGRLMPRTHRLSFWRA